MKRLIIKFGGTSVGSIEKIKEVAKIIKKRQLEGNQIITVVHNNKLMISIRKNKIYKIVIY